VKVLITRRIPPPAESILRQAGFDVQSLDCDEPPARTDFLSSVKDCAGVLAMMSERIDAEALDAAGPGLRIVANYAVGYDNIDVRLCRERGVVVTNTPDVLTEATADLAWALIMSAARRVAEGDRMVRAGQWRGWAPTQLLGMELHGATLGIVGAGRIGSAVARRSRGFDMNVLYAGNKPAAIEQELNARRRTLDELLRESDIVSLHVPMRPENRHLIGRRELGVMKPGSILINTARGAVVDEAALLEVLRSGAISAGLDVYEREPSLTPGLAELSNVVLLPHLGSATHITRQRMSKMAAENIVAVLSGKPPRNPVNQLPQAVAGEKQG
jgi:glyoxylate reductase